MIQRGRGDARSVRADAAAEGSVKSEMIEAGLDEFIGLYGGWETDDWSEFARMVLVPTYLRMERARRAGAP
jgi:hypothetical protein